jgi:hypothetical protein
MPHPTPLPLRQVIRQRAEQGQGIAEIAAALDLVPRTVRHLLQRIRMRGQEGLAPSYACSRDMGIYQVRNFLEQALALRREHPTWGAGLIRVFLRRGHPQAPIPAERTVQRWFQHAGLNPAPSGRRPTTANPQRAQQPHQRWQVDAAEQVGLKDGTRVCWLRIVDECTGAVLETAVFPPAEVELRSGYCRSGRFAPCFSALGTTSGDARGQRHPVGFVG